jgi:S-(hydroxymethyl)glutathione dehydrogenase/alcohol dehydrogenase
MARKAKAAICRELNKPIVVEEIGVDAPGRGEVLVKLGACGVCHSDLSAINGTIALPLPLVLGHEGAGVVEEVGEGVSDLAKGDHVVFSFIYMCGKCRFCVAGRPVLCLEQGKALTTPLAGKHRTHDTAGKPLNIFSGCGSMAEYATVSAENLIQIDENNSARLRGAGRLRRHHRRRRGVQHRQSGSRGRRSRCSAAAASAVGDPGRAHRRRGEDHRARFLA